MLWSAPELFIELFVGLVGVILALASIWALVAALI